tara:strand:+ start:529 stop:915 length:387 start_codon:yes stop_codon:yes gene_type:complete
MGAILCCYGKKKTKEEYFCEIFDGLDIDGSQNLDAEELQTIWELVKTQRIEKLNKELNNFTNQKQQEINTTRNLDSSSMIKKNKKFDLKSFIKVMNNLNMSDQELHEFWIDTKESEITNLQHLLEKHR